MNAKLADPDYEPTDSELRELSQAAFANVEADHQRALQRFFEQIYSARQPELSRKKTPLK